MLYLFISAETDGGQLQMLQTLANPEGSMYAYRFLFAGHPEQLRRSALNFDYINSRSRQDCAIIAYDKTSNTYYPLRRGILDRISLLHKDEIVPIKNSLSLCKKGRISFDISIHFGPRLYTPDLEAYNRELRGALGSSLPDQKTGSLAFLHHRIAIPYPYEGDCFPLLSRQIADMPAMAHSRHRVLLKGEVIAIPLTRTRLLRVQGHNFDRTPRILASIREHTLTHVQAVPSNADFTFFVKLPPRPNGKFTVISEMNARRILCIAE